MSGFVAVGLGGALGAMGRYGISLLPLKSAFPWLTLLTNVLGALVIGFVVGVTADDRYLDETGRFDINGTGLIMYSHGEYFGLGRKLGKFGYSVQKKPKRRKK